MATKFNEVTENTLKGKGLFDVLMRSTKAHLKEEYIQNRIKGSDYSKVYLGAMESVMANTVQYLSATMLEDEQRQQILAQTEISKAELDRLNLLTPLEAKQLSVNIAKAEYELQYLLPLQRDKFELEKEKHQLEIERFKFERDELWQLEKERLELERSKLSAELSMISAQKALLAAQTKQALAQIDLTKAQVQKITEELAFIPIQIEKLTAEKDNLIQQGLVLEKQIEKILAEIELIMAKTESEKLNAGDEGLVAQQIKLLRAQIAGFTDDFNSKVFKTLSDMWVVSRSTNPEAVAAAPQPPAPAKTTS